MRFVFLGSVVVVLAVAISEPRFAASSSAVLEVDREDDDPTATACTPAPSDCSLRGAFINANGDPDPSNIYAPDGTYTLSTAGANEEFAMTGDLDIREDVWLHGDGAAITTINGDEIDRVLDIHSPLFDTHVQITGLTFTGGKPPSGGGGGIRNNFAMLLLSDSVITGNSASFGAGMELLNPRTTIVRSTIFGNAGTSGPGAINNNTGVLNILDTTISGNSGSRGAGVSNSGGDVTITNSTISGNASSDQGGGISTNSYVLVNNTTITGNSSADPSGAGGIFGDETEAAEITMRNTIVAGNTVGGGGANPDCSGAMTSGGYNLIGNLSAGCGIIGETATDIAGQEPMLGPLANNGGLTLTHALNPGSPAIDAVPDEMCPPPLLDQRGLGRPAGTRCDVGALEADAVAPAPHEELWGDNLCDGAVDGGDSLPPLQFQADLSVTSGGGDCPALSDAVYDGDEPYSWGDLDCDGEIGIFDTLALLLWLAGKAPAFGPCLEIGTTISIVG